MSENYPPEVLKRLNCQGRAKLPLSEFNDVDSLFVSFCQHDLDEQGKFKTELIRLPDFSCNWSKFSEPEDVKYRKNGCITDGAFSISVSISKFENFAMPVHDPLCGEHPENYSHCEIRIIPVDLQSGKEPPKGFKPKSASAKNKRKAWRRHIALNANIVVPAEA